MNAPPNGRHHDAFEALFAKPRDNATRCRSRLAPPLANGDNGADPLAPPLANGDNGSGPLAPPLANGDNGADPLAPPLANGDNGSGTLAPPLANGDNGPSALPVPTPNDAPGRDKSGRFTTGNIGGPGNPFTRRTAQLRQAFCQAVSAEDIKSLTHVLLDKAKGGDLAAAKLLLEYVIGRPAPVVDPDTLDFHEWQQFQQVPARPDAVHRVLNSLPSGLACALIRILLPNTERQIKELWLKKIENDERKEATKLRRKAIRSAKPAPPTNPKG